MMSNKEDLYQQQVHCLEKFKNSHLFKLLSSKKILHSQEIKNKILDGVQVISNYFQKMVMLRAIFTQDSMLSSLARSHLNEELGHDKILRQARSDKDIIFDPILESTMAWFCWKLFTLNDLEKTVLMHWVLEASACFFFTSQKHQEIDPIFLENLKPSEYTNLKILLTQSWEVMITACDRIAALSLPF